MRVGDLLSEACPSPTRLMQPAAAIRTAWGPGLGEVLALLSSTQSGPGASGLAHCMVPSQRLLAFVTGRANTLAGVSWADWPLSCPLPSRPASPWGLSHGLPGLGAHDASADCLLAAASSRRRAPMPVIPIPRRVRSFHGPHTTCLHAACGPVRASHLVRTKYNNFDVYLKTRWLYGFIRFLLYFSCSLFTAALWGALAALFCLQYLGVRLLLRFQLKLSVLLLLLGRRRVDFRRLNEVLIHGIHVTVLLVGGLGWCFMVFVDM
nr:transmembrane protein 250 isoform X1 [Loxodonta africana]XP_023397734.1 transmembrane protein 250 isoform X1 [Loxodonta africana]